MDTVISMISKAKIKIILGAVVALMLTGCATILHGTHQTIYLNSSPSGASVYIHNSKKGVTPMSLNLRRNGNYTLVFKKSGYKPVSIHLYKNFLALPSILGNIFWSGIIGIVVDIADGAAFKLTPEQVNAHLNKLKSAGYLPGITNVNKNEIHVVMLTKKQWKSMN